MHSFSNTLQRFRQEEPILFVDSLRKVGEGAGYSHRRYPLQESALPTHSLAAPPRTTSSPTARQQRKTTALWFSHLTNSFTLQRTPRLSCSHVFAAGGDFPHITLVANRSTKWTICHSPCSGACAPPNWMIACCCPPDIEMAHHG